MRTRNTLEIGRGSCRRESASPAGNVGRLGRLAARIAVCAAASLLLAFLVVADPPPASAQIAIGVSITIAPPALPIYVQPLCPGPGYIWIPGYWAWDPDYGYYWVPGTWVPAPYPGLLWTPGYWAWYDGGYVWYDGYWGPVVGFYGGIDYGFGYNGYGYYGGYWSGNTFFYNRTVNNITITNVTNIYSKPVPIRTTRRVSFNGGRGGTTLRPTPAQVDARRRGSAPAPMQREHQQTARRDPKLRASVNRGRPEIAATPKPGMFSGPGVKRATRAGAPYKAPPPHRMAPSTPEGRRPVTEPRREQPRPQERQRMERPQERPQERQRMERPQERPRMERPQMERPQERPRTERPQMERPQERPRMERQPERPQAVRPQAVPHPEPAQREAPRQQPRGEKERE
ncbi:MAG TPA: hypothetical protein VI298_00320 [Geobacteraceae bacterium]